MNLRGRILAFLADTLTSNRAGGFKERVEGARRKCRHCMAKYEDLQCLFMEEDFQIGTKDNHIRHLFQMEGPASVKEFYEINARTQ